MNNPMDENGKNIFSAEQSFQTEDNPVAPGTEQNSTGADSTPIPEPNFAPKPVRNKKKKWVVALAAVVSLLVVVALSLVIYMAVINTQNDSTVNEPSAPSTDGQTPVVFVNNEYFVATAPYDQVVYVPTGTYKLSGEILDISEERALAALRVTDLDVFNYDVDTVKIVDLLTGNTLLEKSVRNPRMTKPITPEDVYYQIEAEFCDECGIIVITETTTTQGEANSILSYYTAKENPELLGETENREHECKDLGDVYAIAIARKIRFFDEDMNLLSDGNADFLEVDDVPYLSADSFMVSETEGYFYFFSGSEALVFEIGGKCTAKYTVNDVNAAISSANVLNNGKLFMQTMRTLDDDATDYDFRISNRYCEIDSFIIDNVTGAIQKITCNFIVDSLSAAYEKNPEEKGFPLTLKDGVQNQAYIVPFANGEVSPFTEYVALDNSLNVVYTFPRDGKAIDFYSSFAVDEGHIVLAVSLGGVTVQHHLVDINGKPVSAYPKNATVTPSFIISPQVIYDHNMREIYNFAQKGYSFVNITGDSVYLSKVNEATEKNELFVYSSSAAEPVKLADGIDVVGYEFLTRNYSVIKDELGWKRVYNLNGELIFMTDGELEFAPVDGGLVITTMIDGVIRDYVVLESATK